MIRMIWNTLYTKPKSVWAGVFTLVVYAAMLKIHEWLAV